MTWLVGNPRFSLVAENRFWLVNGAGPIRPWSDFVGCDRVSRGWEQWGVSRTRLSWPMCWVLGAWFNMAKNVVLLCKVPVDKRCVLSWTVCDYLCWPYCAVFALIFNPCYRCIFLVPDHIWPKTIKGQPALTHVIRNYVLPLVVPPLCLWWVTHSDESAQAQNSSRATTTLVSHPPHSTDLSFNG